MGRGLRPWWVALAVSLLLHASLLGGLDWVLPQRDLPPEPPPIEVQLAAATAPPAPLPPAPPRHPPVVAKPAKPRLAPHPLASPPAEPLSQAEAADAEASDDAGPADGLPAPAETPPPEPPVAAAPAPPPLNPLPPRLDLRFQVRYGLARGEQTLVWVNEGAHYTVTSVAAASGLAGVFYRGRFVQTSRGRITPQGLQPEEFWDQRGDKHSSARFDADEGQLTLTPAKGEPRHFAYPVAAQDALSLFFQLALTAPPAGQLSYTVFNGKKLRDYTYAVRGEETLETALGPLRTLHLVRSGGGGRFEAWLAIDRHYLPVRVLRTEESGAEGELAIISITQSD